MSVKKSRDVPEGADDLLSTEAMPTRRVLAAHQTRAEIIAAATRHFAEFGFAATSIDVIRQELNLSRGGFYHHFADKRSCFEAVWIHLQDAALADAGNPLDTDDAPTPDDPRTYVAIELRRFFDRCLDPVYGPICLHEAPEALGWKRWRELEDLYGVPAIALALALLGKQFDQLISRMLFAAILEAAIDLTHNPGDLDQTTARCLDLLERTATS